MQKKSNYNLLDLVKVMKALRDPDNGCPWDIEQTFETILPYTLEEAYEVADAIDSGCMDNLKEELGDLLFQSIYHAQIADEKGLFNIGDVINHVTNKMITRHPHVFGNMKANSANDVDKIWEIQKNKEDKQHPNTNKSALDDIGKALPSLLRAQKLQKKAAKVGFKWDNATHVLDKLEEEIQEMRQAIANNDPKNQEEELGDIIFLIANYARMLDINAEEALRKCNNKFERRFKGIEQDIKSQGLDISSATLEQMEKSWNKQKEKEKKGYMR